MMAATVASSSLSWPMPRRIPRHSRSECEFPPPFGSMRPRSSQTTALNSISNECWRLSRTPCARAVGDGRLKTSTANVSDSTAVCFRSLVRRFMELRLSLARQTSVVARDREEREGWASRSSPLDYFSFRTPLKGFLSDLTSMKRPVLSSRLTQFPSGILVCERWRTAPMRRLSPVGLFLATGTSFYVCHRTVRLVRADDSHGIMHHAVDGTPVLLRRADTQP